MNEEKQKTSVPASAIILELQEIKKAITAQNDLFSELLVEVRKLNTRKSLPANTVVDLISNKTLPVQPQKVIQKPNPHVKPNTIPSTIGNQRPLVIPKGISGLEEPHWMNQLTPIDKSKVQS